MLFCYPIPMSHDIDILQEALDMEVASGQYDMAQMGFNDSVEQEANRTRELHELKPASWFASVFNTDGELKRREESVKIQMGLTHAKEKKEVFQLWRGALATSAEKYNKGPYKKVIAELKKHYKGVVPRSPGQIRTDAVLGDLDQRNALLWAYSTRAQQEEFKKLQVSGSACAVEMANNAGAIANLKKPSIFARVFNTPASRAYSQEKTKLENKQVKLKKQYQEIQEQREPLRDAAIAYSFYGKKTIEKYEDKHPDLKPENSSANKESGFNQTLSPAPSPKKSGPELWGIVPGVQSKYNPKQDHPYALDDPLNLKRPRPT